MTFEPGDKVILSKEFMPGADLRCRTQVILEMDKDADEAKVAATCGCDNSHLWVKLWHLEPTK